MSGGRIGRLKEEEGLWKEPIHRVEYLLGQKCLVYTDNNPLSHLATTKLGATEQRWVAQLAVFDYVIKYRSGKVNRNADTLSRQYVEPAERSMVEGHPELGSLHQVHVEPAFQVTQAAISVLPCYSPASLGALQTEDPVIKELLVF